MNAMHLTPGRAVAGAVPIILITLTPFFPFASTPTRWFGLPAVLVWVFRLVLLTLLVLQLVDRAVVAEGGLADDGDDEGGGEPFVTEEAV